MFVIKDETFVCQLSSNDAIIGHFRVPLCLYFKASLSVKLNHSYENDFALHENEIACRTHFHVKGSALRLVLKQRRKRTRKYPIRLQIHKKKILRPGCNKNTGTVSTLCALSGCLKGTQSAGAHDFVANLHTTETQ